MNISEDSFWNNEERKYMLFKCSHSNQDYSAFFPEKTYPAYLTALTIQDLVKNIKEPIVLEPGCGLGIDLFFLADMNIKSVGVEISQKALDFARTLQDEFVSANRSRNITLVRDNFHHFSYNTKFDVVYNSGVLEHFSKNGQKDFIKLMKYHSSKWVMIMVPNTKSLVYRKFINQMKKQSRNYSQRHRPINVEHLFREVGIKLVRRTGRNLWLSNYHPINIELKSVYKDHFKWFEDVNEFNKKTVIKLAREERKISDEFLFNYAFTKVYIGSV